MCMLTGCSAGAKWYYKIHSIQEFKMLFLDPDTLIAPSLGQWVIYDISVTNLLRRPQEMQYREFQFALLTEHGDIYPSVKVKESDYGFNFLEPIAPRDTVRAEVYFDVPDTSAQPIGWIFVMLDGEEILI